MNNYSKAKDELIYQGHLWVYNKIKETIFWVWKKLRTRVEYKNKAVVVNKKT